MIVHSGWWSFNCVFSPSRSYKYDESQYEYFIETSDTVRIRKSELDKLTKAEELDVKAHFWATKLIHSNVLVRKLRGKASVRN